MTAAALAALAGLLAERSRATICLALLDGRAWTARELGAVAGIAASTTSEHLDRLVAGGLLTQHRQGRHRYVRLTPGSARLVEELAAHVSPPAPVGLTAVRADAELRRARTCYDHLAGWLGVALTDALVGRGLLDDTTGFALTSAGTAWFGDRGFAPAGRRPVARPCLDWTERRPHLAGQAGAHLLAHLLKASWIVRARGRAVRVTAAGERGLDELLGVAVTT